MALSSPIAGNNNITLLKTIKSEELIYGWKQSFQIDITTELNGHKEIHLYQCKQTRLNFFVPSDIAGSEELYRQLQKFEWFYLPDKWEHQAALKNLQGCNQILEVGCGFGSFVKAALKLGINASGIELNKAAVKIAQEQDLPIQDIELQTFASLYPQSVDAVCSFQVLEHVPNPKQFIEYLLQILKPRGKLIFCVPNSESFIRYQYNLLDMPPHHMTQWSEFSFRSLENIFPVKLEKVLREPLSTYHVSSYLGSYSQHFCSMSPLAKILFNRYTFPAYKFALNMGFRKAFTGQSLYVQFCKL